MNPAASRPPVTHSMLQDFRSALDMDQGCFSLRNIRLVLLATGIYGFGVAVRGATVTIAGSRARDGSLKAAVDTVTLPNGRRLFGAQEPSQ